MSSQRSRALQSDKFAQKRRKKKIGSAVLYSLLCILIAIAIVLSFRIPFLQISSFDIQGNSTIPSADIEAIAASAIQGSYAYIIPRSNIIFYPRNDIKKSLSTLFPQIDSVSISRGGASKIIISLQEKIPAALVCEGFRDDTPTDDSCFYADSTGYVFLKAPLPAENASSSAPSSLPLPLARYYYPTDKGAGIIGTNFIDSAHFEAIQGFVKGSAEAGIVPQGVLIDDSGEYEMYIKDDTTVYFNDKESLPAALSNFKAFWNSASVSTSTKAAGGPAFDYIDLRYGNSIFYSKKQAAK